MGWGTTMTSDYSLPPIEAAEAALQEVEREHLFWETNERRLAGAYPDQFVAVAAANGKVAAVADNLPELYAELRQDRVDPKRVWVRFLFKDPQRFIL